MESSSMDPDEPSKARMRCRMAYASVGIILGLVVFICFLAIKDYYNLHIAIWGFASAFFACLTLIVHIQHVMGDRDVWVYRLKIFILFGFFISIGCVIAFFVYIILAAVDHQTLLPVNGNEQGYYLASIWVFMTWKWSLSLFICSRSYRRNYTTRPESNGFVNFIIFTNLLFCVPSAIPSQPLEEEMT